jgi:hypothetical protein
MIRVARYGASVAAVLAFVVAGAWWVFFSHGARNAWADAIDRLAQVRSATCSLRTHHSGYAQVSKAYLEGSRVRVEDPNQFHVIDFLEGKMVWAEGSSKTARIEDLKKQPNEWIALGSNPLNDLVEMKNAPAERLPDERIDDTLCRVYRVKDTSFIGYKVPWVKLWLDPRSKLPVQIHSVVAESRDMTINDFRWNEPVDQDLLAIAVPQGYKLVESPGSHKAPDAVAPPRSGTSADEGREIPTDEIAKTLDMLGQRIEANYRAIRSWSGTFDVKEHFRRTHDPQYEQISHAAVEFYAEPGRGRIRINNRAVEPTRILGNSNIRPVIALRESRWVRTPDELLRFPVNDLQHSVEGFPRIEGPSPGAGFRIVYREPPKAAEQYQFQGYIDPLLFFGNGQPYWEFCSMSAGALRGERGADNRDYARRNFALRVRRKGAATHYVFAQRFKGAGAGGLELVFSSEAGFNVVSQEFVVQGQPVQIDHYKFREQKGAHIPWDVDHEKYEDRGEKDPKRLPAQHRVYTLKQTQVNEPIDPAVFAIESLGLRPGDRMVDRIENQMQVFDGTKLVPANKFKLQPAAEAKRDAARRDQSVTRMRQIALAMHDYADAKRTFPPAYVADKDGKPLLSWRVLILPYLGQEALYKEFHLDEPWDSQHNKPLIARMPAVYKGPNSKVAGEWKTNYLTVRGDNTVFSGTRGISFAEIRDGTSNTIISVEVSDAKAVAWTSPEDFRYDRQNPISGLVGVWPDGFLAGFADGSVRLIWSSISPANLTALFTRNGGEQVGAESLGQ